MPWKATTCRLPAAPPNPQEAVLADDGFPRAFRPLGLVRPVTTPCPRRSAGKVVDIVGLIARRPPWAPPRALGLSSASHSARVLKTRVWLLSVKSSAGAVRTRVAFHHRAAEQSSSSRISLRRRPPAAHSPRGRPPRGPPSRRKELSVSSITPFLHAPSQSDGSSTGARPASPSSVAGRVADPRSPAGDALDHDRPAMHSAMTGRSPVPDPSRPTPGPDRINSIEPLEEMFQMLRAIPIPVLAASTCVPPWARDPPAMVPPDGVYLIALSSRLNSNRRSWSHRPGPG